MGVCIWGTFYVSKTCDFNASVDCGDPPLNGDSHFGALWDFNSSQQNHVFFDVFPTFRPIFGAIRVYAFSLLLHPSLRGRPLFSMIAFADQTFHAVLPAWSLPHLKTRTGFPKYLWITASNDVIKSGSVISEIAVISLIPASLDDAPQWKILSYAVP